jgi:lipopolysaccharide/colanic/teichoic acid biosynthesis glycosyltransferase
MSWLDDMPAAGTGLRAKRLLDVVGSGLGLAALAPVLGGLLVAGAIAHGWPPVFVQERPGFRGRIFRMVKLRTMTNQRGSDGTLLPDADRLTALGRFLRAASLDELPELWNVLRGDMSLVGPRPLLMEYLPRYTPEQARRHEVRPGATGWAQVHGRNDLTWQEKFEHDVWYVDHLSFGLDLRILGRTLVSVLRQEGISARGHATMPKFEGDRR